MTTTVYLVRHGVTAWNAEGRLAGRLPGVSLNPDGRREAAAVASRLEALPIRAVAASPLERTQETAASIARLHGLAVVTEPAFIERGYAAWQGLPGDEIRERFPDAVEMVARGERVPGVEPVDEMAERMWSGVERLVAHHRGEAVVVVSHADPIRALVARIIGMPAARLRAFVIDTASLSRIRRWDGRAIVDYVNSRGHLAVPGTGGAAGTTSSEVQECGS